MNRFHPLLATAALLAFATATASGESRSRERQGNRGQQRNDKTLFHVYLLLEKFVAIE